jgi:hypothetical protein
MGDFTLPEIQKIKGFGGFMKNGTWRWKDGSAITNPSQLSSVSEQVGGPRVDSVPTSVYGSNYNADRFAPTALPSTTDGLFYFNKPFNPLDTEGNAMRKEISDGFAARAADKNGPRVDSVPTSIDRNSVSYLGGQYTGADGKMYEKELFGDDYEVGTGVDAKKTGDEKGTDWGMDGYGGVALGAGQLGLGVMSYLENQKTADKQRQVMDQQIENNTFALGTAKKKQAAMDRDFGRRPGGM